MRVMFGQPSSHADLVVVGAGMCGVSFARHAAEAGKRVVLLDSGAIGSGMSGSSAGHVMTGFLPSPAEMISEVGAEQNTTTIIMMPSEFVTLARGVAESLKPATNGVGC